MTSETMNDTTLQVLDAVGDAHIALVDAVHGYDVMIREGGA